MLAPGFPGVSRAPIELFPLQDRAQAISYSEYCHTAAARVPGQIAHGLGEGEPAPLDETDSEAAQPGHVLRTVPGADAASGVRLVTP